MGTLFRRVTVWHSGSKYKKSIWRCNRKYAGKSCGPTPNLEEGELENAFVCAFNQFLQAKEERTARLESLLARLSDTAALEKQLEEAKAEYGKLVSSLRNYMEENTRHIQDQEEYSRRFAEINAMCQEAEGRVKNLQKELLEQHGQREQASRALDTLKQCGGSLEEFSPDIWGAMDETVTVLPDKTLVFRFREGTEIPVPPQLGVPKE